MEDVKKQTNKFNQIFGMLGASNPFLGFGDKVIKQIQIQQNKYVKNIEK